MAANEVVIVVKAEDSASGTIQKVQANSVAAGVAIGTVMADIGRKVLDMGRDAVMSFAEVGSQIHDFAQKTGMSAESISELKFAAEQSGSSLEAVATAVKKMNTNIFELGTGSKETKQVFDMLGVSLTELTGKNVDQSFAMIAEKLAEVTDKSTQSALAVKLFGKSGTDLLPMLGDGAAGLEAMRQRARELGIVLDDNAANAADQLGDSLDQMRDKIRGATLQIGQQLAPAVIAVATVFTNLVTAVAKNEYALAALGGVIGGGLIAAVVAFVGAIGVIPIAIAAAVGAVSAAFLFLYKNFDGIKKAWYELWDSMPGPVKTVFDVVKSFATGLMSAITTAINFVIDGLNHIQVPDWVPLIGGKGINIPHVGEMVSSIGDLVGSAVGGARGLLGGLTSSLPSVGGNGFGAGFAPSGGGGGSDPLVEAWKRVQSTLREEMVKTWLAHGEEQRRIAEDMNAATVEEVQRTAERIHQTLGVDMAESVTMAFEFIRDREKALAEARIKNAEEATAALIKLMEAEAELAKKRAQEAFDLTKQLWAGAGGGGMSAASALGFAQLADAASKGITGSVDANGVFTPNVTNNITVSGIVGDPVSTGQAIADAINAAASSGGAVISSGAVE